MRVTENVRTILAGALADITRLAAMETWDLIGLPRSELGRWKADILDAKENIVRYDLVRWLGGKAGRSEISSHSRTLATMADSGLVQLYGGPRGARTARIGLTPEGLALARKLAAEAAAGAGNDH